MLAVSPFCPAFGLPVDDDQSSYEQIWNCLEPFSCSSPLDDELLNPKHSGASSSDPPPSRKKLNHNAIERERRKKVNDLYSTLRSLLPGVDQKKKLSIPCTITQALKYIPQLQDQVERLVQRKEDILSSISNQTDEHAWYPRINGQSVPAVSISQIGDRDAVIQLCTSDIKKSRFSEVLQMLERDELHIISVSTFASSENKVSYTVHVQAKQYQRVQCEVLRKKIVSWC